MSRELSVEKASGGLERYSEKKLRTSLRRSGASKALVTTVVTAIEKRLERETSTTSIYDLAHEILREESPLVAARYGLGRAIMELGPTGYPFEDYVARLYVEQGYRVDTRLRLRGYCVSHEVDVRARRPGHRLLGECKHHGRPGGRCDVKVALYVYARSLDLRQKLGPRGFDNFWLITNTKFTGDAIRYAKCTGLELCGWDYPEERNIRSISEELRFYPITCLTRLNQAQKARLLADQVILCRDIAANPGCLAPLELGTQPAGAVVEEARLVCSTQPSIGPERRP